MTNLQEARNAKRSLQSITQDLPTIIGIAYDDSGYFLIVHLSEPVASSDLRLGENHNIPSEVDNVRVVIEITGTPRIY